MRQEIKVDIHFPKITQLNLLFGKVNSISSDKIHPLLFVILKTFYLLFHENNSESNVKFWSIICEYDHAHQWSQFLSIKRSVRRFKNVQGDMV